ncbi:DUF924 family protein [Kangiella shandongensis]|uniref:DUF924 family protein n=1 Tax=Kangiella shandongensis TaxID=2763258 RepID=UPI001CC04D29|nr:DUF924 family protein [Kangiella shandongensis]
MNPKEVLSFWFEELSPKDWWTKSESLDQSIKERFGQLHRQASLGELFEWRSTAKDSLAEVIVLDQFSRNIYRDSAKAFAQDAHALTLAQVAIEKGFNQQLSQQEQQFLYLPFMHSESKKIHQEAVKLYAQLDKDYGYDFELKHKEIIDRFGRYPHRNKALGRRSTTEEQKFLQQPGSSF